MRGRIVVIGSSNIDFCMKMDRLPARDESVGGATFLQAYGGKGANQAVAAARAGGEVVFLTCVGDDAYGEEMAAAYERSGVNTTFVRREKRTPSGAALIMIGEGGHNYLSVAPGANDRLSPRHIDEARELIAGSALVLMQFEIPFRTIVHALESCSTLGVPVIWNCAPAQPFERRRLVDVRILVVNEPEAAALTGHEVTGPATAGEAARAILELGPRTAIVTLGAAGSVVATADPLPGTAAEFSVPAFPVEPVDTTAAGDTYCGCLAVALAEGVDLPRAVRFASAAAALCVQKMGAQPSTPWRHEIDALLASVDSA